jgi:GGDEF domain-containing protein
MTSPLLNAPAPLDLPGASWLTVGAMLADLAFETDPLGRFTNLGPGRALGRPAAEWRGQELASLLDTGCESLPGAAELRDIITTVCTECMAWHGQLRLNVPEGAGRLHRLSLAPRFAGGRIAGTYGLLFDLEAPEIALPDRHREELEAGYRLAAVLDVETGLWTARVFGEEISRRLDRLDVEEQPGTLFYLGFASAPAELRMAVAMRLAEELRDIVRPTDLLGRIDETTLGLWCDNMDHLTGGERAARFCATLPPLLPERTRLTVGVAPRWAGRGEDAGVVMEHAMITLRLAQLAGERQPDEAVSSWKVWQSD